MTLILVIAAVVWLMLRDHRREVDAADYAALEASIAELRAAVVCDHCEQHIPGVPYRDPQALSGDFCCPWCSDADNESRVR